MTLTPRRSIALALLLVASLMGGCSDPCKKLVQRLCDEIKDDAKCEEWTERVKSVDKATCEASLQALKAATR